MVKKLKSTMGRVNRDLKFCGISFIPSMTLILIVILIPIAVGIGMSFTNLTFLRPSTRWIGLANYSRMLFSDRHTWSSVLITLQWVVGTTSMMYLIGMVIALILNEDFPGNTLAKVIVIFPWVVPNLVASYMWEWLFDPSYGSVNWIFSKFTGQGIAINWLGSPNLALYSLMSIMVWRGVPFMTIMLLAALKTIPNQLYEAATVDGAGVFSRFRHITLPNIRNVSGVALLLMTIWMFNHFDIPFVLKSGGPASASMLLSIRTYLVAMLQLRLGYAAAHGVFLMILMMVAAFFYLRTVLKEERG